MVLIGIDPYPNDTASAQVRLHEISRGSRGQGAQSFQVKRSNQRIAYPDDHDRPGSTTTRTGTTNPMNHEGYGYHMLSHAITATTSVPDNRKKLSTWFCLFEVRLLTGSCCYSLFSHSSTSLQAALQAACLLGEVRWSTYSDNFLYTPIAQHSAA